MLLQSKRLTSKPLWKKHNLTEVVTYLKKEQELEPALNTMGETKA